MGILGRLELFFSDFFGAIKDTTFEIVWNR